MDQVTAELDTTDLVAAFQLLGALGDAAVFQASGGTANVIVAEAKTRLARYLGATATGKTEGGIVCYPDRTGRGWIVESSRDPMPALPIWIEKGTKKGEPGSHTEAARAYFYPAIQVEEGDHYRRIEDAMQAVIDAVGLGS
jgi:hypothetical protein